MTIDHMKEVLQDAFDNAKFHRDEAVKSAAWQRQQARGLDEEAGQWAIRMHDIHESARKLGIELDVPAVPEGAEYVSVAE